jgi:hypothetical protein
MDEKVTLQRAQWIKEEIYKDKIKEFLDAMKVIDRLRMCRYYLVLWS